MLITTDGTYICFATYLGHLLYTPSTGEARVSFYSKAPPCAYVLTSADVLGVLSALDREEVIGVGHRVVDRSIVVRMVSRYLESLCV